MSTINKKVVQTSFLVLLLVFWCTTFWGKDGTQRTLSDPAFWGDRIVSTKNDLTENSYYLSGKIKEIGDNYFIVTADVVDFSKIDTIDFSSSGTLLPTIVKDYRVNITEHTVFTSEKFNQAFLSGYITIESKEGIYTTDILTAKSVTIPPAWETSIIAEKNRKINEELGQKSNF